MSIIGSNILAGAAGSGVSAYEIEQSLRFDRASSHYLNETFSAGQTTWTVSFWVKRANLNGVVQCLFGTSTNGFYNDLGFEGSDRLRFRQVYSGVPSENFEMVSTMRFRDPSAWYHIVLSYGAHDGSAAADRAKIWVNNQRLTAFDTANYPGASVSSLLNANNRVHNIGKVGFYDDYLGAYIAEFNFIDGQRLDPTDFGEEDNNGVWRPIKFAGTYGNNNSVYLKFDPSATNGIGHDHSGNGNNWTASGFTTSGTGTDVMSDTPTTNWCTINPLDGPTSTTLTYTEGNLTSQSTSSSAVNMVNGTIGVTSGKWYWELTVDSGDRCQVGVALADATRHDYVGKDASGWSIYQLNGNKYHNGSGASYGSAWTSAGDVLQIALDADDGKIWFGKNGTYFASGDPTAGTNAAYTNVTGGALFPSIGDGSTSGVYKATYNFGQREFANPPGTIGATDYFNTVTYAGNGSTQSITGVGFQPDLVWIKNRDVADHHALFDSVRGALDYISSNRTNAEAELANSLTSFDSGGFSLGSANLTNYTGQDYVAWCWKAGGTASSNTDGSITSQVSANNDAGFSIVTWTGTGANGDYGHGLNDVPAMIFHKRRDSTSDWHVWHKGLPTDNPTNDVIYLNLPDGENGGNNNLFRQDPTDTLIYTGSAGSHNTDDATYVDYVWTEKTGVSKFGSYDGNGSSDGPVISCGFRPAMVMIKWAKDVSTSESWQIYDNKRAGNPNNTVLAPDSNADEESPSDRYIQFTADGFQLKSNGQQINRSGAKYIFAAWAATFTAGDFKALNTANLPAPDIADGSQYFNTILWAGDNANPRTLTGVGFQPDWVWLKDRTQSTNHRLVDSARGAGKTLKSNLTSAETSSETAGTITAFTSDGFTVEGTSNVDGVNLSGDNFVAWNWKEGATQGFDIVTYTGNGFGASPAGTQTISHSLGVKPAMILVKNLSRATDWNMYHKALGAQYGLEGINDNNNKFDNANYWNDTEPTSTVFSVGTDTSTNRDGDNFVAYCFAEVEGYSAFREFVGNASTDGPFVYLGFRPAFIIIKKHSGESDWIIKDTLRPAYNVNDKDLRTNVTNAEATSSARNMDILSNGFKLRTSDGDYNGSNDSFIVIAFAENPFGGSGVSPATAR